MSTAETPINDSFAAEAVAYRPRPAGAVSAIPATGTKASGATAGAAPTGALTVEPATPTSAVSGTGRPRRRNHHAEGLEAGRRSTRTLLWIILAAAMVLYGFPFLYLLFTSFKAPIDAIAVPPTILPKEWTLENYTNALGRSGVLASFINSVARPAIISTAAVPRPGGSRGVRDHPLQDTEWPGVHHGRTGHPDGPAGRHRHPVGIDDVTLRDSRTPRSRWPSRTPPSRCHCRSG